MARPYLIIGSQPQKKSKQNLKYDLNIFLKQELVCGSSLAHWIHPNLLARKD